MKKLFISLVLVLFCGSMMAEDAFVGTWITTENGKKESVVKVYLATNGKYYGKIVEMLLPDQQDAVCTKCTDELKNHPIVGLMIIKDMVLDGGELKGGKILDPRRGKWFNCTMKLSDGNLLVRGSLGPFGETKTWVK